MATPPSVGDGDDMNASLWGELQSFIDLSMIYAKLPLAPFFRLRQVCKEWNRLASDRQFLEQNFKPPLSSNPYFVLTRPRGGHVLLTSDGSSWSSTPVPRARCEVSGLLFEDSDRHNRIFDLHTRVFHTLPPLPVVVQVPALPERCYNYCDPLILMTVDTSLIPYGFRVIIIEDEITGTRIYNLTSGAWTHKPSTHEHPGPAFGTSCVHYNKSLYIRVEDEFHKLVDILTYDLERDEWDCRAFGGPQDWLEYSDIGMWQDRWFVFVLNPYVQDHLLQLRVVESLSNFEKPWAAFDSLPGDLCEWMKDGFDDLNVTSKFYGEHVLFYNREYEVERALLYNLDRKTWDKIERPGTPMLPKRGTF